MCPGQLKVLELGFVAMACSKSLALSYGSTPQYSRQRYMLLRHVLLRILKGATGIGKFIFSPTVKLQSKCLTIVRSIQSLSRTATTP
jgi:hypothetical protein